MHIATEVLLAPAKKAVRGKLISAASQILEEAIGATGGFNFAVIDSDESTPNGNLRRTPITFGKVDGIAVEVEENRYRNASLCKYQKRPNACQVQLTTKIYYDRQYRMGEFFEDDKRRHQVGRLE